MIWLIKTYSYKRDKNVVLSKHFKVSEFRSYNNALNKLTTDKIMIDEDLITTLESLYSYLDKLYGLKYIIVTSGYRSDDFENYLSGKVIGYHVKGRAADIKCYNKDGKTIDVSKVACALETLGIKGIGVMNTAIHVDTRSNKSYFDERNGKTGIDSWYKYFNISTVSYLSNNSYKGSSIVDALKEIKIDSSFNNRKKLAILNGISNYTGTSSQNISMLNKLKNGKLIYEK